MKKTAHLIFAASLLVGACGSGNDSNGSSSGSSSGAVGHGDAANGVYYGTLTSGSGSGAKSVTFFGLVDANGKARFIENSGTTAKPVYTLVSPATISTSGAGTFSAAYTAYGATNNTGTMAASVTPGAIIVGTLTDSSGATLNYSLSYEAGDWETGSSLATIAGSYTDTYSLNGTDYTASLAIDSSGNISGSDNRGCKYNGSVSVPDSSRNGYEVGGFTSSCLSGSAFSGVGSFSAASGLSKAVFRIAVDNGSGGVFLKLTAV